MHVRTGAIAGATVDFLSTCGNSELPLSHPFLQGQLIGALVGGALLGALLGWICSKIWR